VPLNALTAYLRVKVVTENRGAMRPLIVVAVAAVVGGTSAGSARIASHRTSGLCRVAHEAGVAAVAYLRGGDLHLLELASCRDRVLAHAQPPVRFSADGRWLAFGRASLVAAAGGPVLHPARMAAYARRSWAWSPRRERLAVVTQGGGLVLTTPRAKVRLVTADGWGAQEVAFAPARSGFSPAMARAPAS
jgi:hypothetical protein